MIKQCKVLMRNAINMVILFDGKEVQMPTDNGTDGVIYVKKINGKFFVTDKAEFERSLRKPKFNREVKVKEVVEDDNE